MSSQAVLTVAYLERPDERWPRIQRFIAIVALIHAAANIGVLLGDLRRMWPFARIPAITLSGGQYMLLSISSAITVVIYPLLIVGAINLLRRGSGRLILIGCWALIIEWIIGFPIGLRMQSTLDKLPLLVISLIHGASINIFPAMIIVCLHSQRMR